jgi:hypothetical protein
MSDWAEAGRVMRRRGKRIVEKKGETAFPGALRGADADGLGAGATAGLLGARRGRRAEECIT